MEWSTSEKDWFRSGAPQKKAGLVFSSGRTQNVGKNSLSISSSAPSFALYSIYDGPLFE